MDKIDWSEKFSVGVGVLDEQHKTLVAMINNLIDTPNIASNEAVITEMLDRMIRYATTHFEKEEGLMRIHNCPEFTSQRKQHVEFMKNTAEFCKVEEGTVVIQNFSDSLLIYLREWWLNHILVDDMKYKSFFEEKGLS